MVTSFKPMRFLAFGVRKEYYQEYVDNNIDHMSEALLVQENTNTLSLYMGYNYGINFKRVASFMLKDQPTGDTFQTFNIVEVKILSVYKMIGLVEKT